MDYVIDAVSDRLEREVTLLCQKAEVVGASVGVVRDGKLAWSHGYGLKDVEGDEAPGSDTLFRIASITKTFTGTAIFQLRDRGLLDLDDPLSKHIPEFVAAIPLKGAIEDVTLRRMLCHYSGLMSYVPVGRAYFRTQEWPTMSEIIGSIPEMEVSIEPDSAMKYSNLAFGLLGEVVTRVSGRPYEDFIAAELLEPLGMKSTTFEPEDELKSRTATGYMYRSFEDAPVVAGYPSLTGESAAGQLYSTVEDLARWVGFHLGAGGDSQSEENSNVLSVRSRKEMQRPIFVSDDWNTGTGLPWHMRREGGVMAYWHNGAIDGFGSIISFISEGGTGVIGLFNRGSGIQGISSKIFEIVKEAEDAHTVAGTKKKPSVTPVEYREYLGAYQHAYDVAIKIEYREGSLQAAMFMGDQLGPPTVLLPTDEPDVFRAKNGRLAGDRIVFGRSAGGVVNNVQAEAMLLDRLD